MPLQQKTPLKRQLDLPQAFVEWFIPPLTASSSGPDVQPLLTRVMLDGKSLGEQQRMQVSWSKNKVNEISGRVSYEHKLLIPDAVLALLPAGAYVDTVKATGRDSITVNCCSAKQDRKPQTQQQQLEQQQAPSSSQHTAQTLPAGKRRSVQAALKVTSAAAKRQRTHHQPGLAGQHSVGVAEDSDAAPDLAPAGQHGAAAARASAAAVAAVGAAGTAQHATPAGAAGSKPHEAPASQRTSNKKYPMVSMQLALLAQDASVCVSSSSHHNRAAASSCSLPRAPGPVAPCATP
jgi:hypothetical protein